MDATLLNEREHRLTTKTESRGLTRGEQGSRKPPIYRHFRQAGEKHTAVIAIRITT